MYRTSHRLATIVVLGNLRELLCNTTYNEQGFEQYLCEMMPDNIKSDDTGNVTWVDERVQGTVRSTFEQAQREQLALSERARMATSAKAASFPVEAAAVSPVPGNTNSSVSVTEDVSQTRASAAVIDSDASVSVPENAQASAPASECANPSAADPVHVPL